MRCASISFFVVFIVFAALLGSASAAEVTIAPEGGDVSIAAGGCDTVFAAWESGGMVLFDMSVDGGQTWGSFRRQVGNGYSPAIDVDRNGTIYLVWEELDSAVGTIYFSKADRLPACNGDRTFTAPLAVMQGASPYVASSSRGENIYIVSSRPAGPSDPPRVTVFLKRSQNGGLTFPLETQVSGMRAGQTLRQETSLTTLIGQDIAVSEDGRYLHVVYRRFEDEHFWEIYYTRSTNYGQTFMEPNVRINDFPHTGYEPSVAVYDNKVHVMWRQDFYNTYPIFMKTSTDKGATWPTWVEFVRIDDGDTSYPGYVTPSEIALDNLGRIHVAFANNPSGQEGNVYYDQSTNMGNSFGQDQRVNEESGNLLAPSVAVSRDGRNRYIAWGRDTSGVYFRRLSSACRGRSMWVWTDEITDPARRADLVQRAFESCIDRLYVSVYRFPPNSDGDRMYERADLGDLIARAHAKGIEVWTTYGAPEWPTLCVNANCTCQSSCFVWDRINEYNSFQNDPNYQEFDGWMFDVEPGTADARLLGLYACARQRLDPASSLGAAIRFFWDNTVEYPCGSGQVAPFYEHAIGALRLDAVVAMCYRDFSGTGGVDNGIVELCEDEAGYAAQIGRTHAFEVGLETQCGQQDNVTFCEEGADAMRCAMANVRRMLPVCRFAIDYYKSSALQGSSLWPAFDPSACEVETLLLEKVAAPARARIFWPQVSPAMCYDVIRGDLSALQEGGGIVDLGPVVQVVCSTNQLSVTDDGIPTPGHGLFYLHRLLTQNASGDYGKSSHCAPRTPASGDCPGVCP